MRKVKAPNGDVYELPDAVASGLVRSKGSGFKDAEEGEAAKPQRRSSKSAASNK